MKTVFILLFFFLLQSAKAQDGANSIEHAYVNGIRIDSINATYAQVEFLFYHDFAARFQYGQGTSKKEEQIMTAEGDAIKFRSEADLLNFLDRNGWELVPGGAGGSTPIILKKKK